MQTVTTPSNVSSVFTAPASTLYLALELGKSGWQLDFTIGFGQKPRRRKIVARDMDTLSKEIASAKGKFGLAKSTRVVSCYEIGRDGFWLHRALISMGVENCVVDSSSIEVKRRARRAKSDGLDGAKLLTMLMRYAAGERAVWSVVQVPTPADEDIRHLHRELRALRGERTAVINRIRGLLASQGIAVKSLSSLDVQLPLLKCWNGEVLLPMLRDRLLHEWRKVEFLTKQIRETSCQRRALIKNSDSTAVDKVNRLESLRAIGVEGAWTLSTELFSWRTFKNRRQVGSIVGLVPTPYQSGESHHELGVSKAGNRHVRALAVELAWSWLRYQPRSALSQWYQRRFRSANARMRRIGIVALARKLVVALWRYVEHGVVPEGAEFKRA